MNILVLNGSPRPHGNTAAMVAAFTEGAIEGGHNVAVFNVCQKHIAGCLACEYCHTKGERRCIQNDDMQEVYPVLENADMIDEILVDSGIAIKTNEKVYTFSRCDISGFWIHMNESDKIDMFYSVKAAKEDCSDSESGLKAKVKREYIFL